jgi:hypothetical protein
MTVLMESIGGYIDTFKESDSAIYSNYLPNLQGLIGEVSGDSTSGDLASVSISSMGYLAVNKMAKNMIQLIQEEADSLKVEIEDLKVDLANEGDEYIEETCISLEEEIKTYEEALGISDDSSDNAINNLSHMEPIIDNNIQVLSDIQDEVENLSVSKDRLVAYWIHSGFNSSNEDLIGDFLNLKSETGNSLDISYDTSISVNSDIKTDVFYWLDTIDVGLNDYQRDLNFEYTAFNEAVSTSFNDWLTEQKEKVTEIFPESAVFIDQKISLDKSNLPSTIIIGESESAESSDTTFSAGADEGSDGTDKMNGFLDGFGDMGKMFTEAVTGLRDTLYINEYIIGMFKTATDNLEKSVTLNNYSKDTHAFYFEAEYILIGKTFDFENLLAVVAIIFGIRMVFNIIHLISSANKMSQITNFANIVAGWWSFGIGAIIVTVVLTLLWAGLESVNDIALLLQGEKIPVLKTEADWKMDIFGSLKELAVDAAKDAAEKVVESAIDSATDNEKETSNSSSSSATSSSSSVGSEIISSSLESSDGASTSIMPALSYNDYLRFLLLLGIVDEETKIARILDLIQANLEAERNETVDLNDYATAFNTDATFKVDYIFFKLPFMPENIKSLGDDYSFTSSYVATY